MDGKVLQRLKKKNEEEASEMKDSDAIKFKEGCAAISTEATEQELLPGGLGGFPAALPPEHRWKLFLFKGPVKKNAAPFHCGVRAG